MRRPDVSFFRGSCVLNEDPNFNFQFNRVIQWNGGRLAGRLAAPYADVRCTEADWLIGLNRRDGEEL